MCQHIPAGGPFLGWSAGKALRIAPLSPLILLGQSGKLL